MKATESRVGKFRRVTWLLGAGIEVRPVKGDTIALECVFGNETCGNEI